MCGIIDTMDKIQLARIVRIFLKYSEDFTCYEDNGKLIFSGIPEYVSIEDIGQLNDLEVWKIRFPKYKDGHTSDEDIWAWFIQL